MFRLLVLSVVLAILAYYLTGNIVIGLAIWPIVGLVYSLAIALRIG